MTSTESSGPKAYKSLPSSPSPKRKNERSEGSLYELASYHHIPETDGMLAMNARFRGWQLLQICEQSPVSIQRGSAEDVVVLRTFPARKHKSSIKVPLRVKINGSHWMITKGTSKRGTFTINVGKGKGIFLDVFPPKSGGNQTGFQQRKTDGRPQARQPGKMATRTKRQQLSALARSNGRCERCQKNPAAGPS